MRKTISELTLKGTTTVRAVSRDGVVLASGTCVTIRSLVVHKKRKKPTRWMTI